MPLKDENRYIEKEWQKFVLTSNYFRNVTDLDVLEHCRRIFFAGAYGYHRLTCLAEHDSPPHGPSKAAFIIGFAELEFGEFLADMQTRKIGRLKEGDLP